MISDEALAGLAWNIATIAGIFVAAGFAFMAVAIPRFLSEETQSVGQAIRSIERLNDLALPNDLALSFDARFSDFKVPTDIMQQFANWLTQHRLRQENSDFGDYKRYRTSTYPMFRKAIQYLETKENGFSDPKFKPLQDFLAEGVLLGQSIAVVGWARESIASVRFWTRRLFGWSFALVLIAAAVGYLSVLQVSQGLRDGTNSYVAGILIVWLASLAYFVGKLGDISFSSRKSQWQTNQDRKIGQPRTVTEPDKNV